MSITRRWDIEMRACSPISHSGEVLGTTSMLRRMKVIQSDGSIELVPVISGNSFRGVLRRIGEQMLRDVLGYEGLLPLGVAHALRNGGAIVKTSAEPITGRRLHRLRDLVPQLSVFGGAVGAAPIGGCLQVGHVVPIVDEARPMLRGKYPDPLPSRFDVEALETYSHLDDVGPAGGDDASGDGKGVKSPLMRYELETLTPGTRFESWVQIVRGSALDHAFLGDVLAEFVRTGWLGGRSGVGHGRVATALVPEVYAGPDLDWRAVVGARREEALEALTSLPA
ncbi:RAMP superfamily CRISPR-associated protein [Aldersonia sp. NBC_00410]|uniref:RAMP superfamily CRISPR-associated protein n=1 Tax=Aldersonia sp. NBC_00410 TaxID=2975954 RepID=UPI002258BF31|nr:RAMP superfamily CRISPR-associated protein [Aldersonia sp. NBC_00410]MCX5046230.1 RAMP superfamily CRISPR-associated protein [Aldersonia sp. NBC_00410]